MKEIINKLKKYSEVKENVPLKKHTTYRVGGVASAFVYPKDIDSLKKVLKLLKENNIKHMILGNGSNVLFSDDDYKGIIIKLDKLNNYEIKGTRLIAGAGANMISLALDTVKHNLKGLEFICGVPGLVGGCVYMNAGCYGSDISNVLTEVKALTPDLEVITLKNKDLEFGYRTSFFKTHKDYIILEATFKLTKGKREELEALVKERKEKRLASQPLEYPSAGSVFRNPPENFSGKLIEDLGLKGLKKGEAEISTKHANFIVNKNNACASDIKYLIDHVKEEVKKNYDIDLICEQELINF